MLTVSVQGLVGLDANVEEVAERSVLDDEAPIGVRFADREARAESQPRNCSPIRDADAHARPRCVAEEVDAPGRVYQRERAVNDAASQQPREWSEREG
jgi:hypothetical protein